MTETSPLALSHPHLLEHRINGGVIRIGLLSPTEFEFTTGPYLDESDDASIVLRGIRLRFSGRVETVPNSFALSNIEVSHCESSDDGWSRDDTDAPYHRRMMRDVRALVRSAHERLVSPECLHRLEKAFLDRVDAARTEMIDGLARRRVHLGVEDKPSRLVHDDWYARDLRKLDGVDTHASAHEHPLPAVPGYVLMTGGVDDGLLHAHPLDWGRNPKGWHGRLVFDHYSVAEILAFDLGLDASAVRQVRLQDGNLLLQGADGYERLMLDEARIVGHDMRAPSP